MLACGCVRCGHSGRESRTKMELRLPHGPGIELPAARDLTTDRPTPARPSRLPMRAAGGWSAPAHPGGGPVSSSDATNWTSRSAVLCQPLTHRRDVAGCVVKIAVAIGLHERVTRALEAPARYVRIPRKHGHPPIGARPALPIHEDVLRAVDRKQRGL